MRNRDFIIWLDGYLDGKNSLSIDEIRYIQNKMNEVNIEDNDRQIIIERSQPPINPIIINDPNKNDEIDFPGKPPKIYM